MLAYEGPRCRLLTGLCCLVLGTGLQAAPSVDLPGATTVSSTDLSEPFHTQSKWQFVIRQDPPDEYQLPGQLHFCFLKDGTPKCSDSRHNVLVESTIIYPAPASSIPLLTAVADWQTEGSGGPRLTLV
jgi:hypothetical protein